MLEGGAEADVVQNIRPPRTERSQNKKMKNKLVLTALTSYQWRVFFILVLGLAWRMVFLLHRQFWEGLVRGSGNSASTAWLVYLVSLYAAMTVGFLLFWNRNLKRVMVVCLSLSAVIPGVLLAFPALQAGYAAYALFGTVTGFYHVPFLYYGGFKYAQELRIPAIALFMFAFYLLIDLSLAALPAFGVIAVVVTLTLCAACAVFLGLGLEPLKLPEANEAGTGNVYPLRMVLVTGLGLCLSYFLNFLTENIMSGHAAVFPAGDLALAGGAAQLVTCLFFIVFGMRISIYHLVYITLITGILSYCCSVLGVGGYVPAFLLSRACGVLLILSFYSLATAIICRYPRKPALLPLLTLYGGVGVLLGNTTASAISGFLLAEPSLFYGFPILALLLGVILLPFLFRSLREEVNLDSAGSGGKTPPEPGASVDEGSETYLARFQAINLTFDDEYRLTEREMIIAGFLVERYDYETISNRLNITVNTLKTHVKSIYRKYNLRNRKDLIELLKSTP